MQLHSAGVCFQRSVSEWMYKALQVELQDWQRDQEPDTDHEGFYQTSLPTIITQVNIHVCPRSYRPIVYSIDFSLWRLK